MEGDGHMSEVPVTCATCGVVACYRQQKDKFPKNCQTANLDPAIIDEAFRLVTEDKEHNKISVASAEIEGHYYGKATRVEEIMIFAHKMGYKRIGIATCAGCLNEAKLFAKICEAKGLEPVAVACKVGAVDKCSVGVADEDKLAPGMPESMCNPILQAKALAAQKTDLNVILGLCVGHDTLFMKYTEAPATVLFVKDRVTGHNPVAPLYLSGPLGYYKRLTQVPYEYEE